jgi:hypothetical protein
MGATTLEFYSTVRTRSSLSNLPPADYAMLSNPGLQRNGSPCYRGYAPRPIAQPNLQGSNGRPALLISR